MHTENQRQGITPATAPNRYGWPPDIQTALREWAYARASSEQRKNHLPEWTHRYNWHRPHGSLNSKSPINRLGQPMDNLLRFHT